MIGEFATLKLATQTDEALMLAYGKGEFAAFEEIYRRHRNTVYRMMLRQGCRPGIAEELCQEIWMKLIAASASYVATAKFTTWLFRVAQNHLIDHLRTHGRLADIEQSLDAEEEDETLQLTAPRTSQPEVHSIRRENAAELIEAIDALPAPQRETVLLHFEAELTLEEIAQITRTSRETVKSRLRYGVRKIRERLSAQPLASLTCEAQA